MTTTLKILLAGLASSSVIVFGYAVAQDSPQTPSTLAMEVESLEQEVADLSGEEKLEKSVEKIEGMKTVLTDTTKLLEKVRTEEKDILKLNCVNEKQTAIKGFVKVGEQSYSKLKDAVDGSDGESENHHYTLISIAGQKVNDLGEEARVCAGEVLRFAGETQVDTKIDPDIADIDPVADALGDPTYDDLVILETLPELTPFQ